jgi:diguanylate cyclase (GGDEF)-like protein/PAS domain S-box-containing protein
LFWRGRRSDGASALLRFPSSPSASARVLDRLENEYALRELISPDWAAQPTALIREKRRPVLVMRDVGGRPLSRLENNPMPLQAFLTLAVALARRLAGAHDAGLVHRDLNPDNILFDAATGQLFLTGFGLATHIGEQHKGPEPTSVFVSSLAYMAPEQTGRMNCAVDHRADLYALGIILHQRLTGVLPFNASNSTEWVHCHIARNPTEPRELRPEIPRVLSDIVMKLLAKTVDERYRTAAGLAADLRRCLEELSENGALRYFAIGRRDPTGGMMIPKKLYGREQERDRLLAAFRRAATAGSVETVLVSGYSGIGKSSLVAELHRSLAASDGFFAAGKFDQHKRDVPYATLAQAFQGVVRHILAGDHRELDRWKVAIQEAVGANGRLLEDLIPDLKFVIGPQPPAPELSPTEAHNRFLALFRRFIGIFCRPGHPLALFFDDLQWVDSGSLGVLRDLISHPEVRHLLIIGGYRDNEVGPAHPLTLMLEQLPKAGVQVDHLRLSALKADDLARLIADALGCDAEAAAALACDIHEKTGGNPFFSIQLLTNLREEGLLAFDEEGKVWRPNYEAIRAKTFSDNVVDLMVRKLERLPESSRAILRVLACIGNSAPFDVLTLVAGGEAESVERRLNDAMRAEFIRRQGDDVAFTHDRIQEAAYSLIPADARAAEHLRIGRLLAARYSDDEYLFDIVNQLNRGIDLIVDPEEKSRLRRFNSAAGRRAKAATAYASAQPYLEIAERLLPAGSWASEYAETYAVYLDLSECVYLSGNLERADALFNIVLQQAGSLPDRARAYRLRMSLYQFAGRFSDAVDTALESLALFGMTFPQDADEIAAAIEQEKQLAPTLLGGRKISDLPDAPLIDSPNILAMLSILVDASPCVYIARPTLWPLILMRALNLALRHGNNEETAGAYSAYSILLAGRFEDAPAAYAYSEMALALNRKLPHPRLWAVLNYRHGAFVNNTLRPFATSQAYLEQGFVGATENGNLVYAGLSAVALAWLGIDKGDSLPQIGETARKYAAFAQNNGNEWAWATACVVDDFAARLSRPPGDGDDDPIDYLGRFGGDGKGGFRIGIATTHILEQMSAFLLGRPQEALAAAERAKESLGSVAAMACEFAHYFYLALSLTALYDAADPATRQDLRRNLAEPRRKLALWSQWCPTNFAVRLALVDAEIARIDGDAPKAMRLFEEAINTARDNGGPLEEGVADSLAARFWRGAGFERIADLHLRHARDAWRRWGAVGLAAAISRAHPGLDEPDGDDREEVLGRSLLNLDLVNIVKASQAISSEVVLDRVIEALLTVVLEHAGAQRGLLIKVKGDELIVTAQAVTGRRSIEVALRNTPATPTEAPISVLNLVARTRQRALLDDAVNDREFADDPYPAISGVRSVLCLPLLKQAELVGILYLENGLAVGAFTPDRIALLELIASQAAISLENASLYSELEARVAERTQALSQEVAVRADAEEKLNNALIELELVLDNASLGIIIIDIEPGDRRVIRRVNTASERMLGYQPGELNGQETRIIFVDDQQYQTLGGIYRRVLAEGRPYIGEQTYRRKDGEIILTYLVGAALDPKDLGRGTIWLLDDITKQRANEKLLQDRTEALQNAYSEMERRIEERTVQLSQQLHLLGQIIEAVPGPFYYKDDQDRFVGCNSAFEIAVGLPAQRLIGKTGAQAGLSADARTALFNDFALLKNPGKNIYESRMRYADGEMRDVMFHTATFTRPDGEVGGMVGVMLDITLHKQAEERIHLLAFSDQLTGLPNRRVLLDNLQKAITDNRRDGRLGALYLIDLDDFKALNDTRGHDKGDLLLQQVAGRLTACVPQGALVARLGGDEFVIVLHNIGSNQKRAVEWAEIFGDQVLNHISKPYMLENYLHYNTTSIGVTIFGDDNKSTDDVLKQADLAMYHAKKMGRNGCKFFTPEMQTRALARVALEAELRHGLGKKEFFLNYQPQVNHEGVTIGAEALLRWSPPRGPVSPAEFIPLAEETGQIIPIGQWVLESACKQLNDWSGLPGVNAISVAVNVSARQFRQRDFVDQVLSAVEKNNINPRQLKLEITESLLLEDYEDMIVKMIYLKKIGVCFSLDDFGTGYSSLTYLKRLPLDQIKIDQSFVRNILTEPSDAAIARTIIAMADSLGLEVIAEGVETEVQRAFLADIGCRAFQGYLFSHPLLREDFERYISHHK